MERWALAAQLAPRLVGLSSKSSGHVGITPCAAAPSLQQPRLCAAARLSGWRRDRVVSSAVGGDAPAQPVEAGTVSAADLHAAVKAATAAAAAAAKAADAARSAALAADDAAARAAKLLRFASQREATTPLPAIQNRRERRLLPKRIILVRHGESEGNIDETLYCRVPDPLIPLTERGYEQAKTAGATMKTILEEDGDAYKLFFYISPYKRSKQTAATIAKQFDREKILGVREEPQLREQDFGNFQDRDAKKREKAERNLYGRFFYRFPNGESGADVFDRMTMFGDHLVRDIDQGRFDEGTNLVIVTHGLTLRIFLARWFHWPVNEYERVWNPANSAPLVLERRSVDEELQGLCSIDGTYCDLTGERHTKDLYQLTEGSMQQLEGTSEEMCQMMLPETAWRRTLTDEDLDDACTLMSEEETLRW